MSEQISRDLDRDVQIKRAAWKVVAAAQGMVCLVCRDVPAFERRGEFYDTGLCAACAEEVNGGES